MSRVRGRRESVVEDAVDRGGRLWAGVEVALDVAAAEPAQGVVLFRCFDAFGDGGQAENLDIFDFDLTANEMTAIAGLDGGKSMFIDHHDPAMVQWLVGRRVD